MDIQFYGQNPNFESRYGLGIYGPCPESVPPWLADYGILTGLNHASHRKQKAALTWNLTGSWKISLKMDSSGGFHESGQEGSGSG